MPKSKKDDLFPEITADLKEEANADFQNRATQAMEEVNSVLENYKVTLIGTVDYTPGGIIAKVSLSDTKNA